MGVVFGRNHLLHQRFNFSFGGRVQTRCWLIQEKQLGLFGPSSGQRQALLLTTRQGGCILQLDARQAHHRQSI